MKFILKILLLFSITAQAQLGKEAWHWQFGANYGFDFSSGAPILVTSSINIGEGCASISDPNTGQLLFYTDGTNAWDSTNHQMPNGRGMIGGYGSSTQAALIIPKPGNSKIYYLISSDQGGYLGVNQGVHYSIVDMSLHGGLGDVTTKNVLLTAPPTTEKLVGVKHCNGADYWIITHKFLSNAFYAYKVTSNGIDTIPIISNIGAIELNNSNQFSETIGYLKASPNGKKLALAIQEWGNTPLSIIELYDFDNSTGIISNPITIHTVNDPPYGVTFSPDNSKIYTTLANEIYQYDISNWNQSAIINSGVIIANTYFGYALQLAPDGKIYITDSYHHISIINNPNGNGLSCNFQLNAIHCAVGISGFGLPNFIDGGLQNNNLIIPDSIYIQECNSFIADTIDAGNSFTSYLWSTGDTTQTTIIKSPGTYWLTGNILGATCSYTDTIHATLITPIKKDTIVCNSFKTDITQLGAQNYQWNDSTTNPVKTFTYTGTYWANISYTNGCSVTDTFNLIVSQFPALTYPDTVGICYSPSQPAVLNPNISGQYIWNTGSTASQIAINNSGTYWVEITGQYNCTTSDTTYVLLISNPRVPFGKDTVFCNENNVLDATIPKGQYYWSTGATTPSINVTQPGNYWVRVENNKGCLAYDTINVLLIKNTDFKLPNIVTPNNDTKNDFIDFSIYQFSSMQLEIYDRWGKKVFENEDPACIWNPTCCDGTYFYILQYNLNCGNLEQLKTLKGFITVIK